jgi:hypothetical protein
MNATTPMTAERAADGEIHRLAALESLRDCFASALRVAGSRASAADLAALRRDFDRAFTFLATLRAPAGEPVVPNADDEICANCPFTYAGHISNTGCVYPCWKPSGKFKQATTPPVVSSPPSECPTRERCDCIGSCKHGFAGSGATPSPAEQGAREEWMPMDTAPRDGTLIRLLVRFTEHATEDTSEPCPTIGAWPATGDDDSAFQFAGWCWNHDHFCEGQGEPIGWLPMLAPLAAGRVGVAEAGREFFREVTDAIAYAPMGHAARDRLTKAAAMFDKALAGPLVAGEVEPTFSQRTLYDDRDAVYKAAERAGPRLYFALLRLLEAVEERRDQCGIESATIRDAHDALAAATVRPLVYADTAKGSP